LTGATTSDALTDGIDAPEKDDQLGHTIPDKGKRP